MSKYNFDIERNIDKAVHILKAMSNDRRLVILNSLVESEKSVGELEDIVGLSQSALSQHLARLRRDRIVKTRRQAQTIYYSLLDKNVAKIIDCLCSNLGSNMDIRQAAE